MSKVYRAIFISGLRELFAKGTLRLPERLRTPVSFNDLLDRTFNTDWVVYAKKPFAAPIHVLNYLGNYTHRIAFTNHRIVAVSGNQVTFTFKDYRQSAAAEKKTMTLEIPEFLRRYLMHIVPKRFVKIRFYGFMAHRQKKELIERARKLIAKDKRLTRLSPAELAQVIAEYKARNPADQCPKCRAGTMLKIETIERVKYDSS